MARSRKRGADRPRVFNTPLESGLRSLVILTSCYPECLNLHRLVVLDHMIVHTSDIDGPDSLHPKETARAAEMLVRRRLVENGLMLMVLRGLIDRSVHQSGFKYRAGVEAGSFVDYLRSDYASALKVRADWLSKYIIGLSDVRFDSLVNSRIGKWVPEFEHNM